MNRGYVSYLNGDDEQEEEGGGVRQDSLRRSNSRERNNRFDYVGTLIDVADKFGALKKILFLKGFLCSVSYLLQKTL